MDENDKVKYFNQIFISLLNIILIKSTEAIHVDTERGGESVLSYSLLIFTLQNKLLAVLIYINLNHSM